MKDTKLVIFAGVNGAGKSTLYKMLSCDFGTRLNSDEIVLQNGWNWRDEASQLKASKQMLRTQKQLLQERKSFNRETTLCGKSILKLINDAKERGYYIELFYVGVATTELAIERVKAREAKGGHGISEELIEKRYRDSQENLKSVFVRCDCVHIYDNTSAMQEICVCQNKDLKCHISAYDWENKSSVLWVKNLISEVYPDKTMIFV